MKHLLLCLCLFAAPALAQHPKHHLPSAYTGQEHREIKSLSAEDMAELRRGGGMGLAKAAELNGLPGPSHLLELAEAIPLDQAQVAAIRVLFEAMQADAIREGATLLALEQTLDQHFIKRTATEAVVTSLLGEIAASTARLRAIHLLAHLQTPKILSEAQMRRYSELRGYESKTCADPPPGHDAAMWRRHNGCR